MAGVDAPSHCPFRPLIAIDKVEVFDAAGLATPLAADAIEVDATDDPPRIYLSRYAAARPVAARHRGGFSRRLRRSRGGCAGPLRLAIKMIVARWFENRGDVAGEQSLPAEALSLIAPFQRRRL